MGVAHDSRVGEPGPDWVTCLHCGEDYEAVTGNHLIWKHGYERHPAPVRVYRTRFGLRSTFSDRLRRRMVRPLLRAQAKSGHRWTRHRILGDIRALARAGRSLGSNDVPLLLLRAARRRFGGWAAALEVAGIDTAKVLPSRQWYRSRAQVLAAIRARLARGARVDSWSVGHEDPSLYDAGQRLWPWSWRRALAAARVPADARVPLSEWTLTRIAAWIRARHARKLPHRSVDATQAMRDHVKRRVRGGWGAFLRSLRLPAPGAAPRSRRRA